MNDMPSALSREDALSHSILDDHHSPVDPVVLAEREGAFARATGHAGCLNPYLHVAANKAELSDAQHAQWALCCSAWWKGWDEEELRRRPHRWAHHRPGAPIMPWLLGVPIMARTAPIAELVAAEADWADGE